MKIENRNNLQKIRFDLVMNYILHPNINISINIYRYYILYINTYIYVSRMHNKILFPGHMHVKP